MDTQFNVFEILQIAEEVQIKAAQFFLHAAERFRDEERRNLCYDLANWRAERRDTWSRLRRQYSERTGEFGVFDPDNYVLSNPWTMAGLTGYGTDPRGRDRLSGQETKDLILHDALRRSQGIIIFYHGLKEFVRGPDGLLMIDNMINEENCHIRLLTRALEQSLPPADDCDSLTAACSTEAEIQQ